jgi:endonuclease/exonuclease/phosphatase family metal-dependent hydrolase
MKNLILFILLFAQLAVCGQTTVMTYNIRNSNADHNQNSWANRKARLVALIRKVNPDILGTQEVLLNQLKYLKTSLNDYTSFGVGRNNGKHGGEHSALFFRKDKYEQLQGGNFWLSETPQIPGSKSWDAAITRICSWVELKEKATGTVFFVFNTHFDHKGKVARRNSAALLRKTIDSLAGNNPVIVTGDFNLVPTDAGYTTMTDKTSYRVPLSDSYTEGALPYTDCGFSASNTNCNRIDYIFYSPHYTKSSYTVHTDNNGTSYPSDHLTVSVVLTLTRAGK